MVFKYSKLDYFFYLKAELITLLLVNSIIENSITYLYINSYFQKVNKYKEARSICFRLDNFYKILIKRHYSIFFSSISERSIHSIRKLAGKIFISYKNGLKICHNCDYFFWNLDIFFENWKYALLFFENFFPICSYFRKKNIRLYQICFPVSG